VISLIASSVFFSQTFSNALAHPDDPAGISWGNVRGGGELQKLLRKLAKVANASFDQLHLEKVPLDWNPGSTEISLLQGGSVQAMV